MDKELTAAFKKFNDSAVPEKAGCDVGKVIRDLRRSGVCVEEMKPTEWYSLMKGKTLMAGSGKGKTSLMLAKTPAGYVLKAVNMVNSMSRQASADM